jgi:hypothetical protein
VIPPRVVPATPFAVQYLLVGPEPNQAQFSEAAAITFSCIEYLAEKFASDPETTYTGSAAVATSFSTDPETLNMTSRQFLVKTVPLSQTQVF